MSKTSAIRRILNALRRQVDDDAGIQDNLADTKGTYRDHCQVSSTAADQVKGGIAYWSNSAESRPGTRSGHDVLIAPTGGKKHPKEGKIFDITKGPGKEVVGKVQDTTDLEGTARDIEKATGTRGWFAHHRGRRS